jgi:hypothetical protein
VAQVDWLRQTSAAEVSLLSGALYVSADGATRRISHKEMSVSQLRIIPQAFCRASTGGQYGCTQIRWSVFTIRWSVFTHGLPYQNESQQNVTGKLAVAQLVSVFGELQPYFIHQRCRTHPRIMSAIVDFEAILIARSVSTPARSPLVAKPRLSSSTAVSPPNIIQMHPGVTLRDRMR